VIEALLEMGIVTVAATQTVNLILKRVEGRVLKTTPDDYDLEYIKYPDLPIHQFVQAGTAMAEVEAEMS
jgi:hypothetical protein